MKKLHWKLAYALLPSFQSWLSLQSLSCSVFFQGASAYTSFPNVTRAGSNRQGPSGILLSLDGYLFRLDPAVLQVHIQSLQLIVCVSSDAATKLNLARHLLCVMQAVPQGDPRYYLPGFLGFLSNAPGMPGGDVMQENLSQWAQQERLHF